MIPRSCARWRRTEPGRPPLLSPVLDVVGKRYGLLPLPLRAGWHEELFVVRAERQFTHQGPRVIARLASEFGRAHVLIRRTSR